jgi:hypothetical protein
MAGGRPSLRTRAGPRRNEHFFLHVARFPLYVIPPDRWNGIVGLSGSGGTGEGRSKRVTSVRFFYLDRAGDSDRGIELVCAESEEVRHQPDILRRFGRDRRSADRTRPIEGAHVGSTVIEVAGLPVTFGRWIYRDYPELLQLRASLPGVVIHLEGWNLSWEELQSYSGELERLELGTPLLDQMRVAQMDSDRRWRDWFDRSLT